jgi:hypothetical protein
MGWQTSDKIHVIHIPKERSGTENDREQKVFKFKAI